MSDLVSFVRPDGGNKDSDMGWSNVTNKPAIEAWVYLAKTFNESTRNSVNYLFSQFHCIEGPVIGISTGDVIKNTNLKGIYASSTTDFSALESYIKAVEYGEQIMADIVRLKAQGIRHPDYQNNS